MSDWSFVNKFAEGIAKRAGVTTDSVWEAMLSGRPPIGSEEGGPKDKFTEEEVHGFSERLKNWILEHPKEVAKLVACIGAAPTAVAVAPALLGIVGFGPLGPVVGYPAALAQAALGPVAAGSAFAVLQSAGMGGYGLIVVKAIAASGSVAGICSAAAVSFLNAMKEETCDDENKDKKE